MHANTVLGLSPESSHKLIERRSQVFKIDRLIPSVIGYLIPFFVAIFLVLLLVTYIPFFSLWLPSLLGYV